MVDHKPKIEIQPSESLKKKREEQRGKPHKPTSNDKYNYTDFDSKTFRERRYSAERCEETIDTVGRPIYTGKIDASKAIRDVESILQVREV